MLGSLEIPKQAGNSALSEKRKLLELSSHHNKAQRPVTMTRPLFRDQQTSLPHCVPVRGVWTKEELARSPNLLHEVTHCRRRRIPLDKVQSLRGHMGDVAELELRCPSAVAHELPVQV